MSVENLRLPQKGFTKAERKWLEELVKAIKTVHGVAGRHVTISDTNEGQLINADDCAPGQ
jgi:hypothetical protein